MMINAHDQARRMFGEESYSKGNQHLKNIINSFVRNGLIPTEKVEGRERSKVYLKDGADTILFNALIVNAFLYDKNDVKSFFTESSYRAQCIPVIRATLCSGISTINALLVPHLLSPFLEKLETEDLYQGRLPNPFVVLPQAKLQKQSLFQVYAPTLGLVGKGEELLAAFLAGQHHHVLELAKLVAEPNDILTLLVEESEKKIAADKAFSKTLDFFAPKPKKDVGSAMH